MGGHCFKLLLFCLPGWYLLRNNLAVQNLSLAKNPRILTTPDRRWEIRPIGIIESPYIEKFEAPKQATISRQSNSSVDGYIKLFPGYEQCIENLDGFDYLWVLTLMHLNSGFKTRIKPRPRAGASGSTPTLVGLFSSRAPHRPNPIALSALKIINVDSQKGIIKVHGLDLLNDTPVLDIKPYIPAFDCFPDAKAGWMDDITPSVEVARELGYQDILSPRGARLSKSNFKKKSGGVEGPTVISLNAHGDGDGDGGNAVLDKLTN